ncbi:hypothetical protein D3C85_1281950 [compost metagenome]
MPSLVVGARHDLDHRHGRATARQEGGVDSIAAAHARLAVDLAHAQAFETQAGFVLQLEVWQCRALLVDEAGDGTVEEGIVVVAGLVVLGQRVFGDDHHALLRLVDVEGALGVAVFTGGRRTDDIVFGQVETEFAAQQRHVHGRWRFGRSLAGGLRGPAGRYAGQGQGPSQ